MGLVACISYDCCLCCLLQSLELSMSGSGCTLKFGRLDKRGKPQSCPDRRVEGNRQRIEGSSEPCSNNERERSRRTFKGSSEVEIGGAIQANTTEMLPIIGGILWNGFQRNAIYVYKIVPDQHRIRSQCAL